MKSLVLVLASTLLFGSIARAEDHIWSKQGTELYLVLGNEGIGHVKPLRVYSPDHLKRFQIDFHAGREGDAIPDANIIIGKQTIPVELDKEWAQVEVLWSPDSKSLALTGSFNAYTNSTKIVLLTANGTKAVSLDAPHQDMARTYPACKAQGADNEYCRKEEDGASFNYASVAWADPHTVVIMAEVPCSSSQGGIMCQVAGYELDTRTGGIVNRMTARQLKQRWQNNLAFNLHIPTAPEWQSTTQSHLLP
jgi:hypothetical protein